jgi:hypothetical protein
MNENNYHVHVLLAENRDAEGRDKLPILFSHDSMILPSRGQRLDVPRAEA